jgi:hypothetical protein
MVSGRSSRSLIRYTTQDYRAFFYGPIARAFVAKHLVQRDSPCVSGCDVLQESLL